MKIYQLLHTLSYGDAISSEVLAFDRVFKESGFESEVYAINVHPHYKSSVKDYRNIPRNLSGEVILHYSLGSPINTLFKNAEGIEKTIIYHNLTPARWFEGINPRISSDINQGLKELPDLCRIAGRLLADSSFNAQELQSLGFNAEVLSLPVDPNRWAKERNPGIYKLLKTSSNFNVLHVGRLAPNKCIEDIIKSFYFLYYHINKNSHLWLVGIDIDTELYSFALKRLVHELHLRDVVHFVGCLSDEELRSMYEASDVYVCMSEHEGFCLPLVEAMHFGLPVIAYASSAIPETMGDAGILVCEKKHAELAELINKVAEDATLRRQLIEAGKKREVKLSFEVFREKVRQIFRIN
ncbi:MAG: glycosyltransferase family 4 protein [SAR324 cluster bacterium]|uniref:Glycosyltransferase family 4 protein n=1 Tax=SAR324 cluster bacterium TaxID=2024889 RepID=A0A7X9FTC4_9DELT|nr:glycosyltransferase family 4 protein [SAR324 cluster bacterium]